MPAISPLWCYVIVILNVLTDLYLLHIPIHVRHLSSFKTYWIRLMKAPKDALERPDFANQEVLSNYALQWRHLRHCG